MLRGRWGEEVRRRRGWGEGEVGEMGGVFQMVFFYFLCVAGLVIVVFLSRNENENMEEGGGCEKGEGEVLKETRKEKK